MLQQLTSNLLWRRWRNLRQNSRKTYRWVAYIRNYYKSCPCNLKLYVACILLFDVQNCKFYYCFIWGAPRWRLESDVQQPDRHNSMARRKEEKLKGWSGKSLTSIVNGCLKILMLSAEKGLLFAVQPCCVSSRYENSTPARQQQEEEFQTFDTSLVNECLKINR